MAVDYEERYLGKEFVSKKGKKAVVVACHPKSEMYKMPSITVRFEDGVTYTLTISSFKQSGICHPDDNLNKAPKPFKKGDRLLSNRFGWYVVEEYLSNKKVTIRFEDCGRTTTVNVDAMRKGHVAPKGALKTNTQEDWLAKAKELHGNKYDYSETVFTNYNEKLKVRCKECGEDFLLVATDHVNKEKKGCPRCAIKAGRENSTVSFTEFIERAGKAHNWKNTYDLKSYTKLGGDVTVICNIHGPFVVNARRHSTGRCQCPECVKDKKTKDRIASLPERKDYKYLYMPTAQDVWITHEECGTTFKIGYNDINKTFLCHSCGRQRITFGVFLERARALHGEDYEYSNYTSLKDPVTMLHRKCGKTFVGNAGSHLSANYGKGVGCPHCAAYGFNPSRKARVYVLSSKQGDTNFVKVGITHQSITGRLRQISKSTNKLGWVFKQEAGWEMYGSMAIEVEKKAHEYLGSIYKCPEIKFDGSFETYLVDNPEDVIKAVSDIVEGIYVSN